jgi:hypothetical protein
MNERWQLRYGVLAGLLVTAAGRAGAHAMEETPQQLICEVAPAAFRDVQVLRADIAERPSGARGARIVAQPVYVRELHVTYDAASRRLALSLSTTAGTEYAQAVVLPGQVVTASGGEVVAAAEPCPSVFFDACRDLDYRVRVSCRVE